MDMDILPNESATENTTSAAPVTGEVAELRELIDVGRQLQSMPPYMAVTILAAFIFYKVWSKRRASK